MVDADLLEFATLLDSVSAMLSRGQYTPNDTSTAIFFRALRAFPIEAVRAAFQAHVECSPFVPTPHDLLARLQVADGRPGAEEAWSIAVTGLDERATIVWTPEIAEAWGVARPVMQLGDEVGARMAFRQAYERIVAAARMRRLPVQWLVAEGHDPAERARAVQAAAELGRVVIGGDELAALPAPREAVALLAAPDSGVPADIAARLLDLRAQLTADRPESLDLALAQRDMVRATQAQESARVHEYARSRGLEVADPAEALGSLR